MRILVTPNTDEYMDRNSLWGLVRALRAAGHQTLFPARAADGIEIGPICRDLNIDVLFQLNRARPRGLPKNVRHVAWFQDQPHIPFDVADRVQPSDLIYRVVPRKDYDPEVKGRCFEGYLLLAIDEIILDAYVPPPKTVDFSCCGTMVPPFGLWPYSAPPTNPRNKAKLAIFNAYQRTARSPIAKTAIGLFALRVLRAASGNRLPEHPVWPRTALDLLIDPVRRSIINIAELYNSPLSGDWNPDLLARKMREIILPHLPALPPNDLARLNAIFDAYALEVPRQMERFLLVENVLHVTDSVELYGVNWDTHPMFAPYHKGIVTGPQALSNVYGRSRINGCNTLRSILHRRSLEIMGIGEFLFVNSSISDHDPSGMRTFFEPGVHYADYTPDNIQEETLRWIKDEKQRTEIGRRAAAGVREKHLWRHRAEQLLRDLKAN